MTLLKFTISIFLLTIISANAQSIEATSGKICDSIKSYKYLENDMPEDIQAQIIFPFIKEYFLATNSEGKDFKEEFSAIYYKVHQDLRRNCPEWLREKTFVVPETHLLEVTTLFTNSQRDSIKALAGKIRVDNKLNILVVSIDDFYPYQDLQDFAEKTVHSYSMPGYADKTGILIVVSKKQRAVRISTSFVSKKYISDAQAAAMIDEILLPNFRKSNYFEGVYRTMEKIRELIKDK